MFNFLNYQKYRLIYNLDDVKMNNLNGIKFGIDERLDFNGTYLISEFCPLLKISGYYNMRKMWFELPEFAKSLTNENNDMKEKRAFAPTDIITYTHATIPVPL